MKYIAYGSNMVEKQMAIRCPSAKLVGTGWIEYARLEFYLHATVEHSDRQIDRVPVAVWEIGPEDERRLDRYEGYPRYYIKDSWMVEMNDGSQIEGMIYLMNTKRFAEPAPAYYGGICDAYMKLGFGSQIKRILEPALLRSHQRGQRPYAFRKVSNREGEKS